MDTFLQQITEATTNNPLRGGMINLTGNVGKDMDAMNLPDSMEGMAMMGLTYAAASLEGSTISKSYNDVSEITLTVKYPRSFSPVLDGQTTAKVVRGADLAEGSLPTYTPTNKDPESYGDYGPRNIMICPDPDAKNMYNTIVGAHKDWIGNFFHLLAASQPQDLTPSHFQSFFAWKRTPNIEGNLLATHFHKITGGMPDVLDIDRLRTLLPKDKWIEYRTTFSSGGLLLVKMIEECPKDYLGVFSEQTRDAITAYSNEKHSQALYRAIPEKALGILYAYLMVTEQLPENLWGPKRSYDSFTVQQKESLKVWFTEAKSKMKVYKAATIGSSKTPMPSGVWNV